MKRFCLAAVMLLAAAPVAARVKLPAVLGSNMVLQRNTEVNFWGGATPNSRVRVTPSWNGRSYETRADDAGRWALKVPTGEAGGPYTVTVSDGDPVVLENVLLGEVWICSGQSNMEMPVGGFLHQPVEGSAEAVAAAGDCPGIRMFTVPKVSSESPREDCEAAWQCSTPASVRSFSAVGYFFGRMLCRVLDVPVGLITPNWGGSAIEAWMTVEAIDSTPGIDHALAKSGTYDNSIPQRLYNGMILPVCRFTAKGFIWYQGESNRRNWFDYEALQVSLVDLWRATWGDGRMPFYITQLAPYAYEGASLRSLPLVVEAQYRAAARLEHAGVAATTDLGMPSCIHPARKREVGERLAWLALANDYGIEGLPAPAPTFREMERRGDKLLLRFDNLSPSDDWSGADSFVGYGPEGSCGSEVSRWPGPTGCSIPPRDGCCGATDASRSPLPRWPTGRRALCFLQLVLRGQCLHDLRAAARAFPVGRLAARRHRRDPVIVYGFTIYLGMPFTGRVFYRPVMFL